MYRLVAATPKTNVPLVKSDRALVRVVRRRYATLPVPPTATTTPPVKGHAVRNFLIYTTVSVSTFYVTSAFIALHNESYYKFVSANVPLGTTLLDFAEDNNWDSVNSNTIIRGGRSAVDYVTGFFSGKSNVGIVENAKNAANDATKAITDKAVAIKQSAADQAREAKAKAAEQVEKGKATVKESRQKVVKNAKASTESAQDASKKTVAKVEAAISKGGEQVKDAGHEVVNSVQKAAAAVTDGVEDLIKEAEKALGKASVPESAPAVAGNVVPDTTGSKPVWTSPLPLGHEPPPGYSRPAPPKKAAPPKTEPTTPPLPLLAPAVSELTASEPIISHLASTIDNLASYLNANPTAAEKAKDILDTAKIDLTGLASRIDKIKEEEALSLQNSLDEQTRHYTTMLLELEMEAQDKLDSQEDGFRKFFDEEKGKYIKAYQEKLEQELKTQTELINERLKEEVIAQGIELQRRWIRDIKVKVEQERGGRLAKLDELAANIKRLERVALDNSTYLDENLRVHAMWSAIRAVSTAIDAPIRRPFREELRTLRHVAAAKDDVIVSSALASLESSDIPDVGVEPLADLATWFSTSVAPRVASVALVPDQNAGVLSHLTSHVFSTFRFQRRGLVEGNDVNSVLARAEYYLTEKDLDSATRELNQLNGTAKTLLADWLTAARRRLEALQAIEVVNAQATAASLSVI